MADFSDDVARDARTTAETLLRLLHLIQDYQRRHGYGPAASAGAAGLTAAAPAEPASYRFGQAIDRLRKRAAEGPASIPVYDPLRADASLSRPAPEDAEVLALSLPEALREDAPELVSRLNGGHDREDAPAALFADADGASYLLLDSSAITSAEAASAIDAFVAETESRAAAARESRLDGPATARQMALLRKLSRDGAIPAEEAAALGDAPTVRQVNALLNAHADVAGSIDLAARAGEVPDMGELAREADRYEDLGNTRPDTQHVLRQTNSYDADPSTDYPDVETRQEKREDAERAIAGRDDGDLAFDCRDRAATAEGLASGEIGGAETAQHLPARTGHVR